MGKSFYTGTDAELYTGAANFSAKILPSPGVYGISVADAAEFESLNAAYAAAYLAAIHEETRTKASVSRKNAARRQLRVKASDLAKIIDGTSTVTDAEKIELGLAVRKKPAPLPTPTEAPGTAIESVSGWTVNMRIFNAATGARRKVSGAIAAWVYHFVGDSYPSDPTLWQFAGAASKSKYAFTLPNTVPGGARVWVCATWVTRRGEHGPISVPIPVNIQGGGVSANAPDLKFAA